MLFAVVLTKASCAAKESEVEIRPVMKMCDVNETCGLLCSVGDRDGTEVGVLVGTIVGSGVGEFGKTGAKVGLSVAIMLGITVGTKEGATNGGGII